MICLYCGWCCQSFSPLSEEGTPCPKLVQKGTFYFCGDYANRPQQCKDHEISFARFCPIGMENTGLVGIVDSYKVALRIDEGTELIRKGFPKTSGTCCVDEEGNYYGSMEKI